MSDTGHDGSDDDRLDPAIWRVAAVAAATAVSYAPAHRPLPERDVVVLHHKERRSRRLARDHRRLQAALTTSIVNPDRFEREATLDAVTAADHRRVETKRQGRVGWTGMAGRHPDWTAGASWPALRHPARPSRPCRPGADTITLSFGSVALAAITLTIIGPPGSCNNAEQAAERPSSMTATTTASPIPKVTAPAQVAAAGITLHAVDVTLASRDRLLPGGARAEAINNDGVACHSAGRVLKQPSLSRAEWPGEVNKMRHVDKAPVEDADAASIVDDLAGTKGL